MPSYYEIAPEPRLKESVECLWISHGFPSCTRVLPDGCADIIYSRADARSALTFVGTMTNHRDVAQPDGFMVGVRFHPSAWSQVLHLNARELADCVAPLQDLNRPLHSLLPVLDDLSAPEQIAANLARSLPAVSFNNPVQQAISLLVASGGRLSMDLAANAARLSSRQFRRRCLELTSLSPKLLSRILRFRRAHQELLHRPATRQVDIAAACGFADESHLIAEFQRFSGRTPRKNCESSSGN